MPFPAEGWVAEETVPKSPPVVYPLPEIYEGVYTEGGVGMIDIASGAYWKGDTRFIDCGVIVSEGYGLPGSDPTYNIRMRQPNVFGVLLFDWFDVPNENPTVAFDAIDPTDDENPLQDDGITVPTFDSNDGATTPTWS